MLVLITLKAILLQVDYKIGEEAHHVYFQEATDGMKNNNIVIKQKGDKKMEIQLGFLQIQHVYEVSLVMAKSGFVENVGG